VYEMSIDSSAGLIKTGASVNSYAVVKLHTGDQPAVSTAFLGAARQ